MFLPISNKTNVRANVLTNKQKDAVQFTHKKKENSTFALF